MEQKRIEDIYSIPKVVSGLERIAKHMEDSGDATILYSAANIIRRYREQAKCTNK